MTKILNKPEVLKRTIQRLEGQRVVLENDMLVDLLEEERELLDEESKLKADQLDIEVKHLNIEICFLKTLLQRLS